MNATRLVIVFRAYSHGRSSRPSTLSRHLVCDTAEGGAESNGCLFTPACRVRPPAPVPSQIFGDVERVWSPC